MSEATPRRFRLSEDAKDEIAQIWKNIWDISNSAESADKMLEAITERFFLLEAQPFAGRSREEVAPGIRSIATQSGYVIYYRVTDDLVEIAHITHGSRLPENVFSLS